MITIEFSQAQGLREMWTSATLKLNHPLILVLPVVLESDHLTVPLVASDEFEVRVPDIHVVRAVGMQLARGAVGGVLSLRRNVVYRQDFDQTARKNEVVVNVTLLLVDVLDRLLAIAYRACRVKVTECYLIPRSIVLIHVICLLNLGGQAVQRI